MPTPHKQITDFNTNVSASHIGHFGSIAAVALEKASIADGLSPGASLIVPAQLAERAVVEAHCRELDVNMQLVDVQRDVQASYGRDGTHFQHAGGEVFLPMPGAHQLENLLLCLEAVASLPGLNEKRPGDALASLSSLAAVRGRLHSRLLGKFVIWDDTYNANLDSFLRAARFVSQQGGGGNYFVAAG